MKRLLLNSVAMAAATPALAHTSVVPHGHPHELSVLPDVSAMALAALVVACGVFALRKMRGR